ncbi:MAG TPA: cytochrome c biogenesis protein CcsA [Thermoanaerobaculia bacterium]|nr:cytochrome c biogenesis protein CcsA [Thermoanaerobaculia bacterium]
MSPSEIFLSAAIVLLPLAYLVVAIAYGRVFFAADRRTERLAPGLLLAVLTLHLAYLGALTAHLRHFPAASIAEGLSVVALAVGITYALVEWLGRERSTGFWIVSVIFFVQLLASVLRRPEAAHESEVLKSAVFAAHAFLALMAYAAFVMAAAYGFLFLELYRELKSGAFSIFYGKLPPLEVLERMMAGALHVGWIALTGAAGIGAAWAYRLYGPRWAADPIILLTLATWGLYSLALVLRRAQRWQGRQTAVVSLAGLCAILISLVVVNFVVGDFHGFPGAPGS